jgi:hypothetical protein
MIKLFSKIAQFANANEQATLLVEISNDLKVGEDGWAMIAPYGDFPGMAHVADGHGGFIKAKAIQRIDKEAATSMANEFTQSRAGFGRYLSGCCIYKGHPDVPGYEKKYPDKSPVGLFSELAVRDDGFYGKPIFTNEGFDLVETKKFRALSGRWNATDAGKTAEGVQIYRPTTLLSAGLTNQPNLPVQLLNEKDEQDKPLASEESKEKSDPASETPRERAERLSNDAHTGSHKAYAASRKANDGDKAEDHVAAFHAHADASAAHTEAANAHTECKNFKTSAAHTEFAEEHQGLAIKHARAAKSANADLANDKTVADAAEKPEELARTDLKGKIVNLAAELETAKKATASIANDKDALDTKIQTLSAETEAAKKSRDEARVELSNAKTGLEAARTDFAKERSSHIETEIRWGIVTGKMGYNEKDRWQKRLAADFANESRELERATPKIKVQAVTAERDGKKFNLESQQDRAAFLNEALEAICREKGWDRKRDYNRAFAEVSIKYPEVVGVGIHPRVERG